MSSGSFKNVIYKLFVYKSYIFNIYMYKSDLVLNNRQGLLCHKTQPTNQTNKQPNKQTTTLLWRNK